MTTTYIVSGYMRSGTSMMMMALEAGGLEAVYNPSRDRLIEKHSDKDYRPNPALYELTRSNMLEPDFPRKYEGKLIKYLFGGISRICAGNYKIIFMLRDFEEVRQSHMAFFKNPPKINASDYEILMKIAIGILRQRRDVDLTVLQYRDVIDHPLRTFEHLRHRGWPLDPVKAEAIVLPELCRYRHENLTVGVL